MAINQNHLFEDLNGIKCSIVEKNVSRERTEFLKRILEYNRFVVVVVPSPPPKAAPAAAAAPTSSPAGGPPPATPPPAPVAATPLPPIPDPVADATDQPVIPPPITTAESPSVPASVPSPAPPAAPPAPETFTVGVTDVLFNPTNAIFGRLLKAPGGHIVTLSYWQQKESQSNDEIPYFDAKY